MIRVASNDESRGFNLNQLGDYILVLGADADWARFQVEAIGNGSFGSAVVNLYGSLDLAGENQQSFFELDASAAMSAFGISKFVNVTGIPTLRLQVKTAQGSASTPAVGRLAYAPRTSP